MIADPQLVARAEAGELEAQRELCALMASDLPDGPELEPAIARLTHFARLAAAQGDYSDTAHLVLVLGWRAGWQEGDDKGAEALAEAIELFDQAADEGHEDAAAALVRMPQMFPAQAQAAFAIVARRRRKKTGKKG